MFAPFLALLAALQTMADQQPGEVRIFSDWAVGCDNGFACEAVSLPAAMAVHLAHDCDGIDDLLRNVAYPLAGGGDLILISCSRGAYNFSDIAFIRRGDELVPAGFDRVFAWGEARDAPLLVNADWGAGELSTYAKGRGIGDCGTAERFVWDGRDVPADRAARDDRMPRQPALDHRLAGERGAGRNQDQPRNR